MHPAFPICWARGCEPIAWQSQSFMTRQFRKWLAEWLRQNRSRGPRYTTQKVNSPPSVLKPNIIYLIGDDECDWAAVLRCPCGCGELIHLSLVLDTSPSWRVQIGRKGLATLSPSVYRSIGCRSHFIIYQGRLIWCKGDDQEF